VNRLSALVVSAAVLALLSGCAPGSPTPLTSTSPESGTPSPAETVEAGEHPVPGFGDGCAALVPMSLITAISPDANTPHDMLATEYAAFPSIPQHAAIAQAGGLLCEWSNGEPYTSQMGTSGFRGIQLSVLPDAAQGWITFTDYYGLDPAVGQVYCSGSDFYCGFDFFESGYWFNAEAFVSETPGTLENVQALVDHLRRQALAFGAAAEPWMPAGHVVVPNDCAIILPGSVVDEVFGAGHSLDENDGGGGWSIWAEGFLRNSDTGCGWFNETQSIGTSWLNGGAWLAAELGATDGSPLPLDGLASDDSATITCDAAGCDVTLIVAGNWFDVNATGSPDDSSAATRLASHLVDVVRG